MLAMAAREQHPVMAMMKESLSALLSFSMRINKHEQVEFLHLSHSPKHVGECNYALAPGRMQALAHARSHTRVCAHARAHTHTHTHTSHELY